MLVRPWVGRIGGVSGLSLQDAGGCRADGDDAAAFGAGAVERVGGRGGNRVGLLVHRMVFQASAVTGLNVPAPT